MSRCGDCNYRLLAEGVREKRQKKGPEGGRWCDEVHDRRAPDRQMGARFLVSSEMQRSAVRESEKRTQWQISG